MEKESKTHYHPKNNTIPQDGHRLEAGDIIQEGDMFDSPNGLWKIATGVIGLPVGEGAHHLWIRPAKKLITTS